MRGVCVVRESTWIMISWLYSNIVITSFCITVLIIGCLPLSVIKLTKSSENPKDPRNGMESSHIFPKNIENETENGRFSFHPVLKTDDKLSLLEPSAPDMVSDVVHHVPMFQENRIEDVLVQAKPMDYCIGYDGDTVCDAGFSPMTPRGYSNNMTSSLVSDSGFEGPEATTPPLSSQVPSTVGMTEGITQTQEGDSHFYPQLPNYQIRNEPAAEARQNSSVARNDPSFSLNININDTVIRNLNHSLDISGMNQTELNIQIHMVNSNIQSSTSFQYKP